LESSDGSTKPILETGNRQQGLLNVFQSDPFSRHLSLQDQCQSTPLFLHEKKACYSSQLRKTKSNIKARFLIIASCRRKVIPLVAIGLHSSQKGQVKARTYHSKRIGAPMRFALTLDQSVIRLHSDLLSSFDLLSFPPLLSAPLLMKYSRE
jgi:hypothetical protein